MVAFSGFRDRYAPRILLPQSVSNGAAGQRISGNISASQLKTKRRCSRLWWFEKVCGLKLQRSEKHFLVGHLLHGIAERYLLRQATTWADLFPPGWDKGLEEHEGQWMRMMAELAVTNGLWQSSDQVQVEYPLIMLVGREHLDHRGMPRIARASTYTDKDGTRRHAAPTALHDGSPLPAGWDRLPPFVGFIDVAHLHSTPAVIEDHKTAKNRKYALTSAKLAEDVQVLSYSALPLALRPDLDQVRLRHNIFLKDPDAKTPCYAVNAFANAAMVARNWNQVIEDAEDMQRLREQHPPSTDPQRAKADGWHKIPCAIDAGKTKDACEAYGGCPMRDVCFGRATIEQVTSRLSSPDPLVAFRARQEAMSFSGMRAKWLGSKVTTGPLPAVPALTLEPISTTPTPSPSPEPSMPFARPSQPKPLAMHEVVYVPDPDNAAVQYKGTIANAGSDAKQSLMVMLWPDVNVEPDMRTIGDAFIVPEIPWGSVSRTQLPTAKLTGYAEVAAAAGSWTVQELSWKALMSTAKPAPTAGPVPTVASSVAAAKVSARPPRDNLFGGGLGGAAAQAAATAPMLAPVAPAPEVLAAPTYVPKAGQTLRVLANAGSTFWAPLAGKLAVVDEVTVGDPYDMVTVAIDNHPYPNVAAGRFELVSEATGPVPQVAYVPEGAPLPPGAAVPPAPVAPAAPAAPTSWQEFLPFVGQLVSLQQMGQAQRFNGTLEKVAEHGIEMMSGNLKLSWDKIAEIALFDAAQHTPGYKPPKLTKEEKAALKEKEKADKEAEKERVRQAKIQAKMDLAAKKVLDRENARAAAKAAAKSAPAAPAAPDAQPSAAAVPPAAPIPAQASAAPAPLLARMQAPAGAVTGNSLPAPEVPPLFKAHEAIPHLDAAIASLQQVRSILAQA